MTSTQKALVSAATILVFTATSATTGQLSAQPGDGGPGTEMTQIINRLGMGSDCSRCQALAAQMDQGGPHWVEQNFEYVVAQTISNAKNLGHRMGPVQQRGVRAVVRRSIRLSR